MPAKVLTGPFAGQTASQLRVQLLAAQAELASGGGSITGGSVNGNSFQKTAGPTVLSRIKLLQSALAQVDPDFIAPSHTIAMRFGRAC